MAAALFVLGLGFVAFGPHRVGDSFAETDFYGGYVEGAVALQHGRIEPARYGVVGPGYEVALAAIGSVVPDLLSAAELLSIIAAASGLLLWIRLLQIRADPRLAFVTTLFLITNPTFFRYGYSATNDLLAFALQAVACCALLTGRSLIAAGIAGCFAALAFLTRYNAIALVPVGLIALLAGGTLQINRPRAMATFLGAFALVAVPWAAYSVSNGGAFAFRFYHNIAFDVFARPLGIPWDDYQEFMQPHFNSLADVILRDPAAVLRRQLFNVVDHLRWDALSLLGIPVAACAVAGACFAWFDGTSRRLWPVILLWALIFLTLVPFFYAERYSIPLLPFYAILAASAFTSPHMALALGPSQGLWLKGILILLPLALSLHASVQKTRSALAHLPLEALESAAVLRELARPGDRVICRKPHVAYHSGAQQVAFPFTRTIPELAEYARRNGVRWLYFSRFEALMRPAYLYLLDSTAHIPGLTRRLASTQPAILYEIGPDFGIEPGWMKNDTLLTLSAMIARVRLDPYDLRALTTIGEYFLTHDDADAARQWLERATAHHPDSAAVWVLLGHAALELKDPGLAQTAYERALVLEPRNLMPRLGLGWASIEANDVRSAASWWRPIVRSTRHPGTLQRMALVFHELGDTTAEREALETLTALVR